MFYLFILPSAIGLEFLSLAPPSLALDPLFLLPARVAIVERSTKQI